jgi:hypothetical protein
MDSRIADIAKLAKSYGQFSRIFLNTNGDFLTEELAQSLDGHLDEIIVSLYMDEPKKSERGDWIKTLFNRTEPVIITMSDHIPTHFSPKFDVEDLARRHINSRCNEPQIRVIINHRQQYLLCCDDVIGNFDLGTFPEIGIKDHWFGGKHEKIRNTLKSDGGRVNYPYCTSCPRA